jgi:hypothetical protein
VAQTGSPARTVVCVTRAYEAPECRAAPSLPGDGAPTGVNWAVADVQEFTQHKWQV